MSNFEDDYRIFDGHAFDYEKELEEAARSVRRVLFFGVALAAAALALLVWG